jgi:hypothetical protein
LPKGYGFLKFGNLVVRLSFPYQELPKRHPDFLERPIQNRAALERQRATAGALGFGNGASTANGDTKRETTGAPPSNDLKPDSSQSQYLK